MSDQRMGTATVCLTPHTLPHDDARPSARVAPRAGVTLHGLDTGPHAERAGSGVRCSVAGQLAVGRPVRTGRLGTQPLDLVLLVVGKVALEPEPLAVTLVGEDVRGHP